MSARRDALAPRARAAAGFDVGRVRLDFPVLARQVRGKALVYFDNAATAQKPQQVLDAMQRYYLEECANVHRGVHYLSERATREYENARAKARRFLNARNKEEIVFVRGATEGINLVAHAFARPRLREGDEVLITALEHHSNIVPWQMVCEERGASLKVAPVDDAGELQLDAFERLLGPRTRIVAVTHVSNALGTVNPVREIVERAHARGVPVLLDGAQAAPHLRIDVQALGCDFYTFSGHKAFGPTGIGVLYGRGEHLEGMAPYQGGGEMIRSVTFEKTTYARPPARFEAGTPNIAGAIGLGAALDYLGGLDMEAAAAHEQDLLDYGTRSLQALPGLRLIGTASHKAPVLSFVFERAHPHDLATILDLEGIAIRAGHHCAQPLMHRFGVPATARASLAFYNMREEIDALIRALERVREVFH